MKLQGLRRRTRSGVTWFIRFLGSERCFYMVIICFVLQALWLAATARYPMAFDENFHFGLIQLHANQWLPFFTHQPTNADAYGAVVRDPSYLYHFLMSIPYRLIRLITPNTTAQIIVLRLINIALFASGFALFRRLLLRLGGSRPLVHTCLLLVSLLPIVPFLAAQINYDNLLFPVTAGALLMVFTWSDALRTGKPTFAQSSLLASLLLLACLIKYAFLPILAAVAIIMIWQLWGQRRHWAALWGSTLAELRRSPAVAVAAGVLLVVSVGLFSERYAVNTVRYHTPIPDCAQVLSVADCSQYGPWQRDYLYAQQKPSEFKPSLYDYLGDWLHGMWERSLFAISDTYVTMPPLPIIGWTASIVAVLGGVLFLRYGRRILADHPYRQYMLAILAVYTLTLFVYIYRAYAKTGVAVAVNGRYLVPFLPIIFLYAGLGFSKLLRKRPALKAAAALIVFLFFLQGGGALTFTVQSDPTWNWQSAPVVNANSAARKVLHPLIAGSRQP